ncbi:MAG: trypsin-like peptidase domain-containing protein [Planctomycetes bacterium]|nr:trypsin-like peptidase domain-containing protein [Planctomycetota bacterium]
MRRMTIAAAWASIAALSGAQAQDDPSVASFQKAVRAVVEKARPAYVFVGGGSGVCISPDGWILTNHHVAGGGEEWNVRFSGGKQYSADLVGWHPLDDVAVLKVRDGKNLPFVPLGDSDQLRVGDPVIAIGNPFRLGEDNWEPTVTFGIVSALHVYLDNPGYKDAIMTDAQINPGNSGGPLITLRGEVVGINGRIDTKRFQNRVNTGIGYAIPSTQIGRFLPHFMAGGRQWGGHLDGVTIAECGDDRYENCGDYGDGIIVAGLEEDCPAERAGLKLGDIIYHIGGQRIKNANRLHGVVGTFPAGSVVWVKYKRWNAEAKAFEGHDTKLLLGKPEQMKEYYAQAGNRYYGFVPDYHYEGKGFKVGGLDKGGPGEKSDLKPGDLITKVDRRPFASWVDFRRDMGARKPGETVKLTVDRDGTEQEVELKLAQRDLKQDEIGGGGDYGDEEEE